MYDWPGNVRQLRNVVESMVVVDIDGLIDVDDLPEEILEATPEETGENHVESGDAAAEVEASDEPTEHPAIGRTSNGAIVSISPETEKSLKPFVGLTLEALERLFIQETLRSTGGNREETAKILGVGERTLYRRIKQFSQENEKAAHDAN